MAFRVKQTAQADRDLDLVLEWLRAQQAGETGLRWFQGLKDALDALSELPHRCPLALENLEFPLRCASSFMAANPISTVCSSPSGQTRLSFSTSATVADYPLPDTDCSGRRCSAATGESA
jgi:hypothetical protein